MRFVCCAITVVVAAACAKGSRSAAPASAATDGTASAASAGNVGTPAVPESASAPAVDTSARQSHLSRAPMSHAPARTAPAIARVAGPSGMLGSKRARDTTPRDTGAAASHSASTPAGGSTSDSVKVNEFMSYDKAKKTVTIDIFEAYNSNLGGFNVNGGYSGNDTITVPEGWSVTMPVVNKDAIPHSAIIITAQMPLPVAPHDPAIPLAYTTHLVDGLPPAGGHDTMRFKASKAGEYILACGVPGHASSGMWIRFNVSKTATVPTYAMQGK